MNRDRTTSDELFRKKMKKVLYFLAAIFVALGLVSCKDKCTYNKMLVENYERITTEYADDVIEFREAEITLIDSIHVADPRKTDVATVTEIYQGETSDSVMFVVFNDGISGESYDKMGVWLGSGHVDFTSINYTLTDALRILQGSGLELPKTIFVTFRRPTYSAYENPLYIFGSEYTFYLFVDAVTGEYGVLDTANAESKFLETEE